MSTRRLVIDLTNEQHQKIRVKAAVLDTTIKALVLKAIEKINDGGENE